MKRLLALAIPLLIAASVPRVFTIGGEPFTQADILDARAQPDVTGHAAILITLSPDGAKRLAMLTRAGIDKPMPITLDGKLLAEPVVRGEISDGIAQISGNFTLAEADALALQISGKPPIIDSLEGP